LSAGSGADARLVEAVEVGDLAAARAAVAAGASVRAKEAQLGEPLHVGSLACYMEPLHVACCHGHLDVAQWLHSSGASLNSTDSDGYAPLHFTCSHGHLDVAQWLHSAGASLDATSREGQTPLHRACNQGQFATAQWLCSVGANATLKTNDGRTPALLLQQLALAVQLDQQALRSTLACLVRRAQAQGPLPRVHHTAPWQALKLTSRPALQMQRRRVLGRRPATQPARAQTVALTRGCLQP